MKIYSMTATFGKLEHEQLHLQPGLNIIEAPNEWGKSTWCSFLITMLYGLETRAKSTKTALADKEKYLPWSGSPMAGRIDLSWQGRDITIERRTKGRTPLGEFHAYETESGLPVPELTAGNCGAMLLGVEKSVFIRSGFLRLKDLPVTEDDALRRRLNDLVTTGDESGDGDQLAQKLKELKNHCRHNRTGLIPQTENQKEALTGQYQELMMLKQEKKKLLQRQTELSAQTAALKNHQTGLEYAAAKENEQRLCRASEAVREAANRLDAAETACKGCISKEKAEQIILAARDVQLRWNAAQEEGQYLPQQPQMPETPEKFAGLLPAEAVEQTQKAAENYKALQNSIPPSAPGLWILGGILLLAGAAGMLIQLFAGIAMLCTGGAVLIIAALRRTKENHARAEAASKQQELEIRYGSVNVEEWITAAREFSEKCEQYEHKLAAYRQQRECWNQRIQDLRQEIDTVTGGKTLDDCRNEMNDIIRKWEIRDHAQRELEQIRQNFQTMQAMTKTAQPPARPDKLTYPPEETERLLWEAMQDQHHLQMLLGQNQGKMDALGEEASILMQLQQTDGRIERLEKLYAALELAQDTLTEARAELQRRFAPKISNRAQEIFEKLTESRYDRLMLGEDLSMSAAAQDEDTVRSSLWRSDGTVDQLYLALRLAVTEELTPEAPLILDDALVRFDDERLKTAMEILKSEAKNKQILLFTCQSRENRLFQSN